MVIEPAAQVIHKCTHTGYYGAHLTRYFVGFEAHSESGEFVAESLDCSVEEYFFSLGDYSSCSPFCCKADDVAFELGEASLCL